MNFMKHSSAPQTMILKTDNAKKNILDSSQPIHNLVSNREDVDRLKFHALLTLNSIRNAMAIRAHCVAMLMDCR